MVRTTCEKTGEAEPRPYGRRCEERRRSRKISEGRCGAARSATAFGREVAARAATGSARIELAPMQDRAAQFARAGNAGAQGEERCAGAKRKSFKSVRIRTDLRSPTVSTCVISSHRIAEGEFKRNAVMYKRSIVVLGMILGSYAPGAAQTTGPKARDTFMFL